MLGPLAAGLSGKKFAVMVEEDERGPFSLLVMVLTRSNKRQLIKFSPLWSPKMNTTNDF